MSSLKLASLLLIAVIGSISEPFPSDNSRRSSKVCDSEVPTV